MFEVLDDLFGVLEASIYSSVSDPGPDSIRSVYSDPDPDSKSGSGSRRAKMTHKK
jgi:hypothetical protein